ncbi:hypothetical protein F2Q68_00002105 [Brassica cretica]|uniref:Uncharacterized protein n=1 Tax=Brassica cretica TaxID=69181 RepID=A0A8S9J6S9_BRACR|nr:hypothetical protein F2Q68_00002105 [Brassica cretica]
MLYWQLATGTNEQAEFLVRTEILVYLESAANNLYRNDEEEARVYSISLMDAKEVILAFQCHRFEVRMKVRSKVVLVLLKSGSSDSRQEAIENQQDVEQHHTLGADRHSSNSGGKNDVLQNI